VKCRTSYVIRLHSWTQQKRALLSAAAILGLVHDTSKGLQSLHLSRHLQYNILLPRRLLATLGDCRSVRPSLDCID
jgi:hypothetical protein